jgi:hypothetical protein
MRRAWVWILLVFLAAGCFTAAWTFLRSPYWSLYQIGKAIHDHEPRLFLAYVDLDQIIQSQKDDFVDVFMPERSQEQRANVNRILGALMGAVSPLIKDQVVRMVADRERENLPTAWALPAAAAVTTNGDAALVVLSDPKEGRRLRMGMRRDPEEGHWRVVEIDPRDIKDLLGRYLKDKRGD